VNIREGVGDISIPVLEALPTTEPPKYIKMAIHCAAAEHGVLMKKKDRKESSWVKLKAFPTNVGRPNHRCGLHLSIN